jgi:hypothetical protein
VHSPVGGGDRPASGPSVGKNDLKIRTQQLCCWCGPALIVVMTIGLLLAGFIPPPSPQLSAIQVAEVYRSNTTVIRIGVLLTVTATALLAPYFAVISVQMKRIEGAWSPLTYTQLLLAAAAIIEFVVPLMLMQAAAFRADRSTDSVQTLNDVAWLMFLGVVSTFVLQLVVIGVAILQDDRDTPVMPRWSGFFNIWAGLMLTPGSFCVFFHVGPFAWDGILVWWMPLVVFSLWFLVMAVVLYRSIGKQEHPEAAAGPRHPIAA